MRHGRTKKALRWTDEDEEESCKKREHVVCRKMEKIMREKSRICIEIEGKIAQANSRKARDTMWGEHILREREKKISYMEWMI